MTKAQTGKLSLAVDVEQMLNAAFVESLVAPSTGVVVDARYTATGGVLLRLERSSSASDRGREETRGPADS